MGTLHLLGAFFLGGFIGFVLGSLFAYVAFSADEEERKR